MVGDSGIQFDEEMRYKGRELPANQEVNILSYALGINFKVVPTKVVNVDDNDIERILDDLNISDPETRIVYKNFYRSSQNGGYTNLGDGIIYDFKDFGSYLTGSNGISWESVLNDLSPVSVHEAAHWWTYENGPREVVEEINNGVSIFDCEPEMVEGLIAVKIWAEGVATYIAKRTNDYILRTMVEAVGNDRDRSERTAREYKIRYPNESMNEDDVGGDVEMLRVAIEFSFDNKVKKLMKAEAFKTFQTLVAYRLGYNLVNRMVDVRREGGMSEAEALLDVVRQPPGSLKEIKEILRV